MPVLVSAAKIFQQLIEQIPVARPIVQVVMRIDDR
jgi:hypothetical protein